MPRALSDILTELNSVYDPQRSSYNQQITALDPQQQAEQRGLEATKQDAFSQITDQANRRGLFYSGIPVAEEQKYTGSTYLPSVANLRAKYTQQKFNLQDAISKITADQYNQAYGVRQGELNTEQRAAADAAALRAAGAGGASPSLGFGDTGTVPVANHGYSLQQRAGGGFNFQNQYGNSVSAAQYSKAAGIPFTDLLQQMAKAGDVGAKAALGLVGNDYGFNRTKITSPAQLQLLQALGVNTGGYRISAASAQPARGPSLVSRVAAIRPGTNAGQPSVQQQLDAARAAQRVR